MAKKKVKEQRYNPSEKDIANARFCWGKDIAFSISKSLHSEGNSYYVERYKISKYSKREYVKKDTTKPVTSLNRKEFTLFEAEKMCFELYSKLFDKLNKIIMEEEIIEPVNNKKVKPDKTQKVIQVDLLDSIKEIEDEMINQ